MKTKLRTEIDPKTLNQVIQWILQSNSDRHIRAAVREKYPKENPDNIIALAVKEITDSGKEDPAFTRGWAMAATRELTRKMIEVGDFANALSGIKQLTRISEKTQD